MIGKEDVAKCLKILWQSVYFVLFSFLPIIITSLVRLWQGLPVYSDYNGFAANLIGTCIPIITFGFLIFGSLKEKGEFRLGWVVSMIAYTFGIIFVLVNELKVPLKNSRISWIMAFLVFVITGVSIYLQKKNEMYENFDVSKSRSADIASAEEGVFQ